MTTITSSFWLDRPTLVTGGTGLVGGWLVKSLIEKGATVVCVVRDWVPHSILLSSDLQKNIIIVHGDITDQFFLERVLAEYEIATVFHLAAQTVVGIANRSPISTFESNIKGTWALLEACRRSALTKQIIIASSDKAYGDQEHLPYDESHALQGRHPYDVSKSCADLIAQSYAKTFHLPVVISRCGNFYGGGDLNWNRIVPGTIRSLLRGQAPIIRSDGTYVRDYLYVEDGAAAYVTLAEKLASNEELRGHAFNFSYEEPLSVTALVGQILKCMASDVVPVVQNQASNEIHDQYLSAEKARRMLGWTPSFSLEKGLRKTVEWYTDYFAKHS